MEETKSGLETGRLSWPRMPRWQKKRLLAGSVYECVCFPPHVGERVEMEGGRGGRERGERERGRESVWDYDSNDAGECFGEIFFFSLSGHCGLLIANHRASF